MIAPSLQTLSLSWSPPYARPAWRPATSRPPKTDELALMKVRSAVRLAALAMAGPMVGALGTVILPAAAGAPVSGTTTPLSVTPPSVRLERPSQGQNLPPKANPPKANPPKANPAVVGLALSGVGASLRPPTSPTTKSYGNNCHALIDPGFTGECVIAVAPSGTVAGVVEEETAVMGPGTANRHHPAIQERDLVWRRQAGSWALALVHAFQNPGPPAQVWEDDVERDHDPKLVFVTPSTRPGFGRELELVEGSGAVTLFRFLGEGFANVPAAGGLVTYVPGWTEHQGPSDAYDQTLIGYSNGSWRVFSEQYVPDAAALRQHRAAFWDSRELAAG
jgi:hypothetical protein